MHSLPHIIKVFFVIAINFMCHNEASLPLFEHFVNSLYRRNIALLMACIVASGDSTQLDDIADIEDFIFYSRTDISVKVSKFLRQKIYQHTRHSG